MQNWEYKKLGDVCDFIGDGDWIESDDQSPEGIRLVQTGNIGNGIYLNKENKAHYISEDTFKRLKCTEIFPGDCLISRLPEPVGRSCIIPDNEERMITAVDCTILRFNKSIISDYFVYYSQSNKYLADIESESTGATRKRISRKNLTNIEIPLPPLDEQKRIVKILDEKFAMLETVKVNAKANLQNAKDLFQSQLTKAFSNTTWEKKKMGDLFEMVRGPFGGSLKKECFKPSGYPVYEQQCAIHSNYNFRYFIDDAKYEEMKRFTVGAGDFVMSCSGVTMAKVSKVPDGTKTGIINQALLRLSPLKNVDANYMLYYLSAEFFRDILMKDSKGAAIPNMPAVKILKEIEFFLPPLPEQKRIVEQLDSLSEKVRSLEEIYTKQLANCDELKQAFLAKAFAGEL